jgi:hypothetical protein
MKKQSLIIEKSNDGLVWGRMEFKDDLMVDSARTIELLQKKMAKLLHGLYDIDLAKIEFELFYDLSALFDYQDFLNVSAIGKKAGISPTLMRQYASGIKFPSEERAKKIERVINELGVDLSKVRIAKANSSKSKHVKRRVGA